MAANVMNISLVEQELKFLYPLSSTPYRVRPTMADHLTMKRINEFACSHTCAPEHKHSSTCLLVSRGVTCGSPDITSIAVAHMYGSMEEICMKIVIREAGAARIGSNVFHQEAARYIKGLVRAFQSNVFSSDVTTIVVEYLTGAFL